MSSKEELACVYAALVLMDDDVAITVSAERNVEFHKVLELF